jgi:hypothetical protein
MITDVVPSPTSSSCVRLSSIIDCRHPAYVTIINFIDQSTVTNSMIMHKISTRFLRPNLCSRMGDVKLSQNCVPIICENNSCEGEEKSPVESHHQQQQKRQNPVRKSLHMKPYTESTNKNTVYEGHWLHEEGVAPPLASRSIFSIDLGPSVVRMTSATACINKPKHQYKNSLNLNIHTLCAFTWNIQMRSRSHQTSYKKTTSNQE